MFHPFIWHFYLKQIKGGRFKLLGNISTQEKTIELGPFNCPLIKHEITALAWDSCALNLHPHLIFAERVNLRLFSVVRDLAFARPLYVL